MARRGADDQRLQGELERLYALPPAAFTAARNELAARLRREGRRDAAAEVKALPRPTASSWATSRLMRLEPERFRALLAARGQARPGERLAGKATAREPIRQPEATQPAPRAEPQRGRLEADEALRRPRSAHAQEVASARRRPGQEETAPRQRSARDEARARLEAA